MGKLFEDIKKEATGAGGNRSRVLEILLSLDEEDRKDFLDALNDHSIPASNISKAMNKRGYKLAVNVITRYRRGELVTKIDESL